MVSVVKDQGGSFSAIHRTERKVYGPGTSVSKDLFVWVDETGCDRRNYVRKYGYAIRGQTPVSSQFQVRGKKVPLQPWRQMA